MTFDWKKEQTIIDEIIHRQLISEQIVYEKRIRLCIRKSWILPQKWFDWIALKFLVIQYRERIND